MQPNKFFSSKSILGLLTKYESIWGLVHLVALAGWDLETYMPVQGASSRGKAIAKANSLIQDLFLNKEFQTLLDKANEENNLNIYEQAVVRILNKELDSYKKLPKDYLEEFDMTINKAQVVWREAKEANNFELFAPHLNKIVDLNIRKADYLGYEENPYDALLDIYEEGSTKKQLDQYFDQIRPFLIDLVAYIQASNKATQFPKIGEENYDTAKMESLNYEILEFLNWDKNRLRLDVSSHPFTQGMGLDDARITTRYSKTDFMGSLSSTIHEYGHALYCLEAEPELEYTPLYGGISLGIHESQSRFWENLIGRSLEFSQANLDRFHSLGENFKQYSEEDFYHYFNRVRPGLIRVEADEVTYHSHIMVRYEIEEALINKQITVNDVQKIWEEKYQKYLGVSADNDSQGVLQDIHWSMGAMGYFSTYSVGTVLSSQIKFHLEKELGSMGDLILLGTEGIIKIKDWLKQNLHNYGNTYTFNQFVESIDPENGFDTSHWENYLTKKYKEIY